MSWLKPICLWPSFPDSVVYHVRLDAFRAGSFRYCHALPVAHDIAVDPPVIGLNCRRGPATIARRIISVAVDAIYGVFA